MATALLIVDVQQGMWEDPGAEPHDGASTVARIRRLLDDARASGVPVFFVQHDGGPGDPLNASSPGFAIVPELAPERNEDVTVKRVDDAFADTDLAVKLHAAGIDRLVVCGMQSEMCVAATVRGAAARGFGVTLIGDAHTTYDTPQRSAAQIIDDENAALAPLAAVVTSSAIDFATTA
jgi:nicotinamidase-related amidase